MNTLSHVAIIMDGNGRWAKKKKKTRQYGHLNGTRNIKSIIPYFLKKKIPYLTLFAFALDNWSRPKIETKYLLFLFKDFFQKNLNYLLEKNIKIKFIGENKYLPNIIKKLIQKIEKQTKNKKELTITIAFNYSSKHEILNSIKKIIKNKPKKINLKTIEKYLYTSNIPDPDILIRTGSQIRISNFLLWQISYSEIFFIDKLWPDFRVNDLKKIIFKFKKIKRNFGAL